MIIETEDEKNVQVRLVGDSGLKSIGRLEVLYRSIWGTVCNYGFGYSDANVVCRQLGFSRAYAYHANYSNGSDPIWLSNIQCTGYESSIAVCRHDGWGRNNCTHNQGVGITCYDGKQSLHVRVNLLNGNIAIKYFFWFLKACN